MTKPKSPRVKQLDFFEILRQYPDSIVENSFVCEDIRYRDSKGNSDFLPQANKEEMEHILQKDMGKNCLISLVKKDNFDQYLDHTAKIYYTGKKFPSTVALNQLYYFMPYLKGKGIRDLYFIKVARVGSRKEGQSDNDPNDLRLVFEIEYIGQMFEEYKAFDLKIWRTFTDTTIGKIRENVQL